MSSSSENGSRHFFSLASVDFEDDAALEEFTRQVWQKVVGREVAQVPSVGRDSRAIAMGEGDMSDLYTSMTEWTGCDKFGHQRQVKELGRKECVHCAEERAMERGDGA